ncbi:MAG: hypothetical protein GY765_33210 [bacterium]|nr:hypothetical protein [bacterium]
MTTQNVATLEQEQLKKRKWRNRRKILLDTFLVCGSLALAYGLKAGDIRLKPMYREFIPIYFGCWIIAGIFSGKFKSGWKKRRSERRRRTGRLGRVKSYFISVLFFAGLLSLFLMGDKWESLSRVIVFGSLAIYFTLEVLLLSGVFLGKSRRKEDNTKHYMSSVFFLLESLVIAGGIFTLKYYKNGLFALSDRHLVILAMIFFMWLFNGFLVHQFHVPRDRNYLRTIWPSLKSNFFSLCILSFMIFFFRVTDFSALLFGSLAILGTFELLVFTGRYLYTKPREVDESTLQFVQAPLPEKKVVKDVIEKKRTESKEFLIPKTNFQSRFIREKLKNRYLRPFPRVFEFIDHVLDLTTIDILDAEVMDSGTTYNIEMIEDDSLEFLLNLHKLNTFRNIDQYLIDVNNTLKGEGFFVSRFEPAEYRQLHLQKKYPLFLCNIVYFFDFIWREIFPKIPGLRRIYFTITRVRNLHMAEAFGRIYFCGFEIVSLEEVDDNLYFIAKKAQDPYTWFKYYHTFNRLPSYGLVFKQKRIGKDKNPIYIYKLQTMHPYSEFIHQYVLELNNLDENGKIMNDFRITSWGKIFRKLWLDEIPMLFNLLKGDIKLVGVRPLSQTFFNTYPKDLQDERTKYKPGLIPPFYADMPKNFDEIIDSERRYLEKYKHNHFKTDFIYFWKAFKNIVFKGAKSG